MILCTLETLLVSLTGGFLFRIFHIPLAWMLGPLTAVLVWRTAGRRPVSWPVGFRNAGLIILGYTMGKSFTVETGRQILVQLPSMMLATLLTIAFSLLLGYITSRHTGITLATSMIGSIPGGLSQMVVLSEEVSGSDVTVVTFMQTVRMLSVVFIVPFLAMHGLPGAGGGAGPAGGSPASGNVLTGTPGEALGFFLAAIGGAFIARRLHWPTPYLLGPVLGSAALVVSGLEAPQLPPAFIVIAQVCVGARMGTTITLSDRYNWQRLFPCVLLGGVGIVLFSLVIGYFLAYFHSLELTTAFLGTAPGGMAEMGLTATAVHADLSVVTAYQLFRLLFILTVVPPVMKRWLTRKNPRRGSSV